MTRILLVTPDYSYFTGPVTRALQQLGFEIKTFDYYKPNLMSRLIGLISNLGFLSHKQSLADFINRSLLQAVHQFQPQFLLVIKGENLTPRTLKQISRQGTVTINWYPDWWIAWDWLEHHAPVYDWFFSACRDTDKKLKRIGINSHYLALAGDPARLKPVRKIYPVSFIGEHSHIRETYFRAIRDLGLHIWGYHGWQHSSLSHLAHGPVSVATAHRIISQSYLTVNLLAQTDRLRPNGINVRTFETTALGTCLLVKSYPLLKQYFTIGKEIVTFTTPQDLRRQVKYYLNHPQERQTIALAGFKRTQKDHTFIHRLQHMFTIVNK
ncbi:MAG: hypothetical protein A2784_04135 [Candidatus Chisholmbacteria bacterium RIFCSPHIGHO2_01_FULL_48_12]|uniref:Spore protein YkvP/CgeB glycosyl transferase-like domain-containing protein n=1 Tax=Candidatus Chisholmbacteria bacterium RIFCSPHIGHO2_01_FULL_48_12 TaxID=1797589 RepID=A0A1G1VNM3_9BACT|nr:MAG: hypothetical protein A2784_04135 [Candidatus Chisholmbacteria bacterium RIFCSPHIGHO2_01_FULL_48_12]